MNKQPYIHPVHQCDDGIISSYSRQKIELNAPNVKMIHLEDIAKGLANTCRFGGQLFHFYSVAQHSILVMMLAPAELRAAALLHDASEAYLGDVIKPLKNMLKGYAEIEEAFERVIFKKFGVDFDLLKEVKPFDMQALTLEYEYIHAKSKSFEYIFKGICEDVFWSPKIAFEKFNGTLCETFGDK